MNTNNRANILLRYIIISVGILLLAGLIVNKLFNTTVIHASEWKAKANRDFSVIDTIQPARGDILASDGSILATNLRYYTIRLDYRTERFDEKELRRSLPALADSLAKYHPHRTAAQWKNYIEEPLGIEMKKRPRAKKILSNLTFSEYERLRTFPFLSLTNRNKNGLVVERNMRRSNPYGQMAKRSIGGVGEQEYGHIHGVSGLEMALDSLLYGVPGTAKKIALTDRLGSQTQTPAKRGFDIITSIDIQMQDIVENELNRMLDTCDADWGVAVLMEVATGDIKAISNLEKSPTSGEYIEGMNRAVLGFEPGSVIKPISMLLALEDGLVNNINQVFPIGASYAYAGGKPIKDSHFNASLTVKGIIEESSNIGMTKVLANTSGPYHADPSRFRRRLEEIGFLDPFNMGIAGERIPYIDAKPSRISLTRMCYGYATEIPPIYTLAMYNAIANGGKFVRPRLVKELRGEDYDSILPVTYVRERICSEENAAKLQEMLTAVVWGDHGTARHWVRDENVRIAGKTGTCYMVGKNGYDTNRKRLSFCGFFPAENPKYSCIVLTCNPKRKLKGAPSSSGQAVKNIASKMYSRGMLGNESDYKQANNSSATPTLYATNKPGTAKTIKRNLNVENAKELAPVKKVNVTDGAVPQVMGMGIREAIVNIEKSGYNVAFNGMGFVKRQSPQAGTALKKGEIVNLYLEEY